MNEARVEEVLKLAERRHNQKKDELSKAARPLIDFIRKYGNPHTTQPAVLLSCPHCHGEGKVIAYDWDKELECVKVSNRKIECDTCHGTGKIGVDDYERIQRKLRESE